MASADIDESSGFCSDYCGWHAHRLVGDVDIKYAFVGDFSRCPDVCPAPSPSPNDNPGVDGMMTAIAHELMGTVTDPDLDGWTGESATLCNFQMGDPDRDRYTTTNGAKANQHLGHRDYLIQQNWLPGGGRCAPRYNRRDLDGDDDSDILWFNTATRQIQEWLMQGTTRYDFVNIATDLAENWAIRGVGDFDEDGEPDILWHNPVTDQIEIWIMKRGARKTIESLAVDLPGSDWEISGVADFNRDGHVDILWHGVATASVQLWMMDGLTRKSVMNLRAHDVVGPEWSIAGIGDFNSDGHPDVVWVNAATGSTVVWLVDGAAPDTFVVLDEVAAPDWRCGGTADFNRDGKADLIWHNPVIGQIQISLMDRFVRQSFVVVDLTVSDSSWTIVSR